MNQLERYVNSLLTVTGNYTINDTKYIPDGTNFTKKAKESIWKPSSKYTFKQFFEHLRHITEEEFLNWSEDKDRNGKDSIWEGIDKLESCARLFAVLGILQRVYNNPPKDDPPESDDSSESDDSPESDDPPKSDDQPKVTGPSRVIKNTSEQDDTLTLASLNTQTSSEIYEIIRNSVENIRVDNRGRRIVIEEASEDSEDSDNVRVDNRGRRIVIEEASDDSDIANSPKIDNYILGYNMSLSNSNEKIVPIKNLIDFFEDKYANDKLIKDKGDKSDLTLIKDDHIIYTSFKNKLDKNITITDADIQDIKLFSKNDPKASIALGLKDQKQYNELTQNSIFTESLKNQIEYLFTWKDMYKCFEIFKDEYKDKSITKLLKDQPRVITNLRMHQDYGVNETIKLIDNDQKNILWGHIPRSGKSYLILGTMIRFVENKDKCRYFIATTAPNETIDQYIDIIRNSKELIDFKILHIKGDSEFPAIENLKNAKKSILIASKQYLDGIFKKDNELEKTLEKYPDKSTIKAKILKDSKSTQEILKNLYTYNDKSTGKFRQLYTKKYRLETILNYNPNIMFFDEVHKGGSTTKSEDSIIKIAKDDTIKIFVTATYSKPVIRFGIPTSNIIKWDVQDVALCKKLATAKVEEQNTIIDELEGKHPGIETYILEHGGKKDSSLTDREKIKALGAQYTKFPDFEMILQQVDNDTKKFLEIQNGKNNGWDINSIFKKFNDEESNNKARTARLRIINDIFIGEHKEDNYPYIKNVYNANHNEKAPETDHIILCFLPERPNLKNISEEFADNIKTVAKENPDNDLNNYKILIVNSSVTDQEIKNSKNNKDIGYFNDCKESISETQKSGQRKMILLLGGMCTLGISIKECDLVIMLNDDKSYDQIFQKIYRCMTDTPDKKKGFVIDFNIKRTLVFMYELLDKMQVLKKKTFKEAIEYIISSNIINIKSELFKDIYPPDDYTQFANVLYEEAGGQVGEMENILKSMTDNKIIFDKNINIVKDLFKNKDENKIKIQKNIGQDRDINSGTNKEEKTSNENEEEDEEEEDEEEEEKNDEEEQGEGENSEEAQNDEIVTRMEYVNITEKVVNIIPYLCLIQTYDKIENIVETENNLYNIYINIIANQDLKNIIEYILETSYYMIKINKLETYGNIHKLKKFRKVLNIIDNDVDIVEKFGELIKLYMREDYKSSKNDEEIDISDSDNVQSEKLTQNIVKLRQLMFNSKGPTELKNIDNDTSIEDRIKLIDTFFNTQKGEKSLFAAYVTPPDLREKTLALVEDGFYKIKDNTVFEPACGRGVYLAEIYKRFDEDLKDDIPNTQERQKYIVEKCLYGSDINKTNVYITKKILDPYGKYKPNINEGDSLTLNIEDDFEDGGFGKTGFNLVIGNFPFTAKVNIEQTVRQSLWEYFVKCALTSNVKIKEEIESPGGWVLEGGQLIAIIPNGWRKPVTGSDGSDIYKMMTIKNEMTYLNILGKENAKKYFNTETSLEYFNINKKPDDVDYEDYEIKVNDVDNNDVDVDPKARYFIPSGMIDLIYKLTDGNDKLELLDNGINLKDINTLESPNEENENHIKFITNIKKDSIEDKYIDISEFNDDMKRKVKDAQVNKLLIGKSAFEKIVVSIGDSENDSENDSKNTIYSNKIIAIKLNENDRNASRKEKFIFNAIPLLNKIEADDMEGNHHYIGKRVFDYTVWSTYEQTPAFFGKLSKKQLKDFVRGTKKYLKQFKKSDSESRLSSSPYYIKYIDPISYIPQTDYISSPYFIDFSKYEPADDL